MEDRKITSVIVKLKDRDSGILTDELRRHIASGWKIIQTLPIEDGNELYLIFTLTKEKRDNKLLWVTIMICMHLIITAYGVYNGIY